MRLAVAGKGGTGKTTVSGTLARLVGRALGRIIAIDGDPNPNLSVVVGIAPEHRAARLPTDLLVVDEDKDGKRRAKLARSIGEIVEEFAATGPDGVQLLCMGEVDHAGAG
ncbi:MAG: AAA family ATPase [Planctomycetota bacterium]